MRKKTSYGDYYNWRIFDDSAVDIDEDRATFTVNFNGNDYTECELIHICEGGEWSGYDGALTGFWDSRLVDDLPEGSYNIEHTDENTILLRLR